MIVYLENPRVSKAKTHAKAKETNKKLYLNEEKLIRLLGAR